MWFITLDRKALGALLDGSSVREAQQVDLFASDKLPPRPSNEAVAVWRHSPGEEALPTAIIIEDSQRREFLAWAATFAPSFRPLTAFIRVVNHRTMVALLSNERRRPDARGIAAAVGAVLGDALGSGSNPEVSFRDVAKTYSFAMARTYALGLLPLLHLEVTEAWSAFSSLTDANDRRRTLEPSRWPWLVLGAVDDGARSESVSRDPVVQKLVAGVTELRSLGNLSDTTMAEWRRRWPSSTDLFQSLRESREVRVSAFQQLLTEVLQHRAESPTDPRELGFFVGYMASRLAPGSLEYFRLIRPLDELIPSVLVWYGIAAALHGDDFIATTGGLGRRLQRDLSAAPTFPERTTADMSVWDLEVFAKSDQPTSPLTMLGNAAAQIELIPDVVCTAGQRMPVAKAVHSTDSRNDLSTGFQTELSDVLEELNQALNRVSNVQYKLNRLTSAANLSRPTRNRPKGGNRS